MAHRLTVAELIAYLQTLPGDTLVQHACSESSGYESYTTFAYSTVYCDCTADKLEDYTDGLCYHKELKTLYIGET